MNQEQRPFWRRLIPSQRLPVVVAVAAVYILILFSILVRESSGETSEITLWEWMGVLIIPVALLAAGYWYESTQARREKTAAEQSAQDEALQKYLDQMSSLLVDQRLTEQPEGSSIRLVATARTTTIMLMLDENRKRHPLKLVYRLRLINRYNPGPLIDLENVDLERADLSEIKLSKAYLRGVNFRNTNLRGSNLRDADLSKADLRGADLRDTDLRDACLRGANLLPYDEQNPAKLSFHNLDGIDLNNVDPSDLSGIPTNLSGANLTDADLSGVYLMGVIGVTNEELEEQAETLEGAIMPDGSKHA